MQTKNQFLSEPETRIWLLNKALQIGALKTSSMGRPLGNQERHCRETHSQDTKSQFLVLGLKAKGTTDSEEDLDGPHN